VACHSRGLCCVRWAQPHAAEVPRKWIRTAASSRHSTPAWTRGEWGGSPATITLSPHPCCPRVRTHERAAQLLSRLPGSFPSHVHEHKKSPAPPAGCPDVLPAQAGAPEGAKWGRQPPAHVPRRHGAADAVAAANRAGVVAQEAG